jgi:hypothetical protein
MFFMQFTVSVPRPWQRSLPDVVIILIIVLVCAHAAPNGTLPLALSGWLGSHLLRARSVTELIRQR